MNDFNELINSDKPTLVDFYATWCGPCKMQAPILEQLKDKVGDAANIVKVDIDRNQELAMKFRVQSVPTIMIFKNGHPIWRTVGLQQLDTLERKIEEYASAHVDK